MVDVANGSIGGKVLHSGLGACKDEGVTVESCGWFGVEHATTDVDREEEVDRERRRKRGNNEGCIRGRGSNNKRVNPGLPGVSGDGFEGSAFKGRGATALEAENVGGGEDDRDGAEREGAEEVEEEGVVVIGRGSFGILRVGEGDVERVARYEDVAEMEWFDRKREIGFGGEMGPSMQEL